MSRTRTQAAIFADIERRGLFFDNLPQQDAAQDFDQHVVEWHAHQALTRIVRQQAAREWALLDGRTSLERARDQVASMSPEYRARLDGEWL